MSAKYEYKNLICLGCGAKFDSVSRNKKQRFCSKVCAAQWRKIQPGFKGFERGHSSWNKGIKGNKSHVFGRIVTRLTRKKISFAVTKSNPKSRLNERIRKHTLFRVWRESVFKRDNYTCLDCGARSGVGHRQILHPHHIVMVSDIIRDHKLTSWKKAKDCNILWDIDNGETLCAPCHQKKHINIKLTGNKAERIISNE